MKLRASSPRNGLFGSLGRVSPNGETKLHLLAFIPGGSPGRVSGRSRFLQNIRYMSKALFLRDASG